MSLFPRSASRVALGLLAVLVTSSSAAATGATTASAPTATHRLAVGKAVIIQESYADSGLSLERHEASSSDAGSLVTSSPAGIDCGDTCLAEFADGTAVTLTATAVGDGYSFSGWSGDCSGSGTCVLMIDRDRSVTANFVRYFPPCRVPKVVGLLLRKAVARINRTECTPGEVTRRRSSKARKNHVLAQSPKPGTTRFQGSPVNLTVGKGPKRR